MLRQELIVCGAVRRGWPIDPLNILRSIRVHPELVRCTCFRLGLTGVLLCWLPTYGSVHWHGHVLTEEALGHADGPPFVRRNQVVVAHIHLLICLTYHLLHN